MLINYVIDPEVLYEYVPAGTAIDFWQGKCYLSLVGFMFKNTRLLGLKVPGHVDFEEVNLRFYVTYDNCQETRRGVVFIKEIVPRPALTWVANTVYREHYQTLPMQHEWGTFDEALKTQYAWKTQAGWNKITTVSEHDPIAIEPGSEEEFITEHYWGYSKVDANTTYEYEVTHPTWRHYPLHLHAMAVNFADTYGPRFAFLQGMEPASVILAEGSPITVERRRKIKS